MAEFAGGDGSPANPFLVATAAQLDEIRNHLDKSFKQIAIISIYDDENLDNTGWTPIGSEENPFTGTYDGDRYYLEIDIYSEFNRAGFFGVTSNAELKNINLEIYYDLYEDSYAGGLVGHAIGGSITNCYCELYSYGKDYLGGLVGVSSSTITNCGTYGKIITQINDHPVECLGGIVGKNEGIINKSYSAVEISNYKTATVARSAGGIAGINTGTIQNCVYANNIYDNTITGTCHRIVAANTGTLIDNYTWTDSKVLGLIVTDGSLTNEDGLNIAADDFTAAWWENLGFILDCRPWYYTTTKTPIGIPAINITWSFKQKNPSSGFESVIVSLEFSSDVPPESVIYEIAYASQPDVWVTLTTGVTATCAVNEVGTHNIRAKAEIAGRLYHTNATTIRVFEQVFAGGSGSVDNPLLVATAAQLDEIRNYESMSFRQIADIDLSGSYWTPIPNFRGNFDGDRHGITGLNVNVTGNGGLIAILWGTIKNTVIINANVKGGTYTGILAGYINNTGIVKDCFITGTSSGGHVTAVNTGTIINCFDKLPPEMAFAGGDGSEENPYRISTPYHLSTVKDFPFKHFMIVNDIDLAGQTTNNDQYSYISTFVGIIDGMGCILSGLTLPLFGNIGKNTFHTEVRNIRVSDVNIIQKDGGKSIGAFAVSAEPYTVIENCSVERGTIEGSYTWNTTVNLGNYVAGFIALVGQGVAIRRCFTNVDIISGTTPAGFVAKFSGIDSQSSVLYGIFDCYCTGNVTGKSPGGFACGPTKSSLVSFENYVRVHRVYATGTLHSTKPVSDDNVTQAGGFSSGDTPIGDTFVVLCPNIILDDVKRMSNRTSRTYGGQITDFHKTLGYGIKMPISHPDGYDETKLYYGTTITIEEAHTKSWWQDTVGFEFTDTNPNAPWTWDPKTQLPIIKIPRKITSPEEPEKPTIIPQDWNLRGVYPAAERGLMWGYWGTKIGE